MILNSIFAPDETTSRYYTTEPSQIFCDENQKEKEEEGLL